MEKMQKLNLRMQKLNFPGTHWRGLALIGAQKNPCIGYQPLFRRRWIVVAGQSQCQTLKFRSP